MKLLEYYLKVSFQMSAKAAKFFCSYSMYREAIQVDFYKLPFFSSSTAWLAARAVSAIKVIEGF